MNSMRDWPHKLKLNAEAVWLAKKIYHATVEVHGGLHCDFSELTPEVKARFVTAAINALRHDARLTACGPVAHVAPFRSLDPKEPA